MVSSLGVVANRKQPILDCEPNSFLDQSLCYSRNAGSVGALPHKLFKVGDRREAIREKLPLQGDTEKYLFRVFSDPQ